MEELFRLISDEYADAIKSRLSADKLSEVRVGNGNPVRVQYDGTYYYLGKTGISKDYKAAFIAGAKEAENIVMRACERSLYTVTETLKRGYVPVAGGIRIGVCGSGVTDGGRLCAVKNISSVNIRLPHEVKGCAGSLYSAVCASGSIKNTLIVSPPGGGKTTVLRDLSRLISDRGFSVLLCDEKYELSAVQAGMPTLDVGRCTDIMSGMEKSDVFEMGIAYMRPDVIMADELFYGDAEHVRRASHSGISVVATVHARSVDELKTKPGIGELVKDGVFALFAVLSGPPHRTCTIVNGASL